VKQDSRECTLHTFCVLAYRESAYLEACLQSLASQTVKSKIMICTSTPNEYVFALAKEYQIECRINPVSAGIGSDWNFAYRSADTPYVTLAHQDDIYLPEYTEHCVQGMADNTLLAFTDYAQLINGKPSKWRPVVFIKRILVIPFWFFPRISQQTGKKMIFMLGNPVSCPSVMLNKRLLGDSFCFNENMKTNMDWLAWLELAAGPGDFFRVPRVLIYHRTHAASATSQTIGDQQRLSEDIFMFEKIWGHRIARIIMSIYRLSYRLNDWSIR
jgi:glycosyltransferase involved in cell wall biosynthesis